MPESKYEVIFFSNTLGTFDTLYNALLFVEILFEKSTQSETISIKRTIKECDDGEVD